MEDSRGARSPFFLSYQANKSGFLTPGMAITAAGWKKALEGLFTFPRPKLVTYVAE